MAPNKLGITTTRSLYKFLVRETQKLPKDASKFYRESIRHGYEQVCHQASNLQISITITIGVKS